MMVHHIDSSWDHGHQQYSHLRWQSLSSSVIYSDSFLQLHSVGFRHPANEKKLQACCVHTRDWVNIFGITPEKKLILVMQFRFGTRQLSLETPGGIVDEGEPHHLAALREFREETGFSPSQVRYVGALSPNAATHTNKIHFYCFKDCVVRKDIISEQDEFECIEVALISLLDFEDLIRKGNLDHALIIAGFFLCLPHLSS